MIGSYGIGGVCQYGRVNSATMASMRSPRLRISRISASISAYGSGEYEGEEVVEGVPDGKPSGTVAEGASASMGRCAGLAFRRAGFLRMGVEVEATSCADCCDWSSWLSLLDVSGFPTGGKGSSHWWEKCF